jgi:hypothetical protein
VARKAGYNFLIAQLTSRWLVHPSTPLLDLAAPAWDSDLPETIGQAMDAYLDTCGPDTALVRRLLSALAFAQGDGLARDRIWLVIADALYPDHTHTGVELDVVFQSAASYLAERVNPHVGPFRHIGFTMTPSTSTSVITAPTPSRRQPLLPR